MLCVSGNYCDNNTEVTTTPLQLSVSEKDFRKKLIVRLSFDYLLPELRKN